MTDVRAGYGENQVDQHAPIERKGLDGGGLDDFADTGVGGVQDVEQGGHDLQSAGGGSELEIEIEGELLVDFKTQSLRQRGEAGGLHGKFVFAGP